MPFTSVQKIIGFKTSNSKSKLEDTFQIIALFYFKKYAITMTIYVRLERGLKSARREVFMKMKFK
jgi:hypothetical protein